jgi:hypothetical protein
MEAMDEKKSAKGKLQMWKATEKRHVCNNLLIIRNSCSTRPKPRFLEAVANNIN